MDFQTVYFRILSSGELILSPWIFCRVSYACRLIVTDLFYRNANVFEYLKQSFSIMSESNCAVMRIASLNKNVTVETSPFRNRKYADRAKGSCSNRKHFTMCNISAELVVSSALQTIEGDVSSWISPSRVPVLLLPEELLP